MTASDHALELAIVAARAASGKLASDVVAIDVSEHLVITDVFVLASAPNDRQVKAIVEGVEEALNAIGVKPIRREGERDGRWVLLDFGELVVHVQHAEERTYYSLERLWKDCPTVPLPEDVTNANTAPGGESGSWSDSGDWSDRDDAVVANGVSGAGGVSVSDDEFVDDEALVEDGWSDGETRADGGTQASGGTQADGETRLSGGAAAMESVSSPVSGVPGASGA